MGRAVAVAGIEVSEMVVPGGLGCPPYPGAACVQNAFQLTVDVIVSWWCLGVFVQ